MDYPFNMPYLTTTIKSHTTRKVYGEQNEEVTIISDHGNVVIVQGITAFPVRREFLSDSMVAVEVVDEVKPFDLFNQL